MEELDRFLTRAKLSPEKGRPVIAKRAEAEAHRKAGRSEACVAAATQALRLLGRRPL